MDVVVKHGLVKSAVSSQRPQHGGHINQRDAEFFGYFDNARAKVPVGSNRVPVGIECKREMTLSRGKLFPLQ